MDRKIISVLGSTGSVGTQALDVCAAQNYTVDMISARSDVKTAIEQIRRFSPRVCVMTDENAAKDLKESIRDTKTKVIGSTEALLEEIKESKAETFVNSILGEAGLMPTLSVIDTGKRLALANKESLVIAGDIVNSRAKEKGCEILPVDSEHSAIFQSLCAGKKEEIKRLILTASGGPFFGYTRKRLECVTLDKALLHPTWKMGKKITVDSATMMNKGFEVIEAYHLFGVRPDKICVTVHPESILHSAVEYNDNAVIGQMGAPDMRLCIQYAVTYPERVNGNIKELDLFSVGALHFYQPDEDTFLLLKTAKEAIALGGAVPAVLNAANEVAVGAFLGEKIGFTDIFDTVRATVLSMQDKKNVKDLSGILDADREARETELRFIEEIKKK